MTRSLLAIVVLGVLGLLVVVFSVLNYRSLGRDSEVAAGDTEAQPSYASEWPMYRGGPQLLGIAEGDLSDRLVRKWVYPTEDSVRSSAAIHDGRVYIGSNDGKVHALNLQTGTKIWDFATEDMVESSPCIVDGRLYVGSSDGFLYCLDVESGDMKWKYETEDKILGSPNWSPSPDGLEKWIVFGSYDNRLYCLEAVTGDFKWSFETGNYVNATPAIANGRAIVGGCDGFVHVISIADGSEIVAVDAEAYIAASAALSDDHAFVGHYGNQFLCVDIAKGEILWHYRDRNFPYFSAPAVDDRWVVFGGRDKRLHCVSRANGERNWAFRARGDVDSSPVLCDGKAIVGSEDGRVYMVGLEDGVERWSYEIGESVMSSPAVAEGMVVIGSDDGSVYAFSAEAKS